MAIREGELAHREGSAVQVRPEAIRARWTIDEGLLSADDHEVRCIVSCGLRVLDDPTERRMFTETFLSASDSAPISVVIEHFRPALQSAIGKTARSLAVDALLSDAARQPVLEAVKSALGRVGFSCGIEALSPYELEMESPTLRRERLDLMERQIAERRAAGELEQMRRAGDLLGQFNQIRTASPELSPGQVLGRLSPRDQASVLRTLLMSQAREDQAELFLVSGPSLARVDFSAASAPIVRRLEIPESLGPLRSVQPARIDGERWLLIGARSGMMVVDPADSSPEAIACYADPGIDTAMGFSQCVAWHDQLWACHADGGIVAWNREGDRQRPALAVRPFQLPASTALQAPGGGDSARLSGGSSSSIRTRPASVRNLLIAGDAALVFSVGEQLLSVDRMGGIALAAGEPQSQIVAIVDDDDLHFVVAHEDGQVVRRRRRGLEIISIQRRAGRVTSAGSMPWMGQRRVLLVSGDGPVLCLSSDDPLITQYLSNYRGLRMAAGSAGLIVAVCPDRQRLIAWRPWEPDAPIGEAHVIPITRHRVADIAFA